MPGFVPEMTEGNLVQWLKQVGDTVVLGEALLEVEGDKAVVEVPAPHGGVLVAIAVPAGSERVAVDTVIGWLSTADVAEAGDMSAAGPSTAEASAAEACAAAPSIAQAPWLHRRIHPMNASSQPAGPPPGEGAAAWTSRNCAARDRAGAS